MAISRKHFIKTAGAFTLGFTGLHVFTACNNNPASPDLSYGNYGSLVPDPKNLFDLPEGFTYKVLSRAGTLMDDGLLVPHRHDGMAAFPGPDGLTILIRNHEVNAATGGTESAFGHDYELLYKIDEDKIYDLGVDTNPAQGGTTTIVYDTKEQRVVRQFLSLAGTIRNCAGGPTPWNSWLSCEETVLVPDGTFEKYHGYVFEVPVTSEIKLAEPLPIEAMGRFNHEAVAVDPESDIIYLTEDRSDGLLYRFIPADVHNLRQGGKLQALVIKGAEQFDTRNWSDEKISVGTVLNVEWIDLENVDSPEDDLRYRGFENGAAVFARGEGMWYGNNGIYFACTNGGEKGLGQIWKYVPNNSLFGNESAKLELFIESENTTMLENADNITVAPWGDIIACEDAASDCHLVGITPEGEYYRLGRNVYNNSELAGAVFSPDGSTLFVNIQTLGVTLAITGPWAI